MIGFVLATALLGGCPCSGGACPIQKPIVAKQTIEVQASAIVAPAATVETKVKARVKPARCAGKCAVKVAAKSARVAARIVSRVVPR